MKWPDARRRNKIPRWCLLGAAILLRSAAGAYAAFGATNQLKIVNVQGGHYWRPEVLVPWLSDQLRAIAQPKQ